MIQPQTQLLHTGENLQLECGAVGRPIPRYQWYRNSVPIHEATKRKLVVRGFGFFFPGFMILLKAVPLCNYGNRKVTCDFPHHAGQRAFMKRNPVHFRFPTRCRITTAGTAARSAAAPRGSGPTRWTLWSVRKVSRKPGRNKKQQKNSCVVVASEWFCILSLNGKHQGYLSSSQGQQNALKVVMDQCMVCQVERG